MQVNIDENHFSEQQMTGLSVLLHGISELAQADGNMLQIERLHFYFDFDERLYYVREYRLIGEVDEEIVYQACAKTLLNLVKIFIGAHPLIAPIPIVDLSDDSFVTAGVTTGLRELAGQNRAAVAGGYNTRRLAGLNGFYYCRRHDLGFCEKHKDQCFGVKHEDQCDSEDCFPKMETGVATFCAFCDHLACS